jgi:hypothetical protein
MTSMSYCRFRNTRIELEACEDHLTAHDLSVEEWDARQRVIQACKRVVEECFDEEGEPTGSWNLSWDPHEDEADP